MKVWICTDMEGLAGIDSWDQCYAADDHDPRYRYGLEQLAADTNAAVAGCFDAGATEVMVLDGHGRNANRGLAGRLDPRARLVWTTARNPVRWEGIDETVHAVAMIGQHAMAGTINGFLDHTQCPKILCRMTLGGREIGEMAQCAVYAGSFGVPLVYVSGDDALCEEARQQLPHAISTSTKRGTGWATCVVDDPDSVRTNIRGDIANALRSARPEDAWIEPLPAEVSLEWAWSELADTMAAIPGVRRVNARTVAWTMTDRRDIYTWPGSNWHPMA